MTALRVRERGAGTAGGCPEHLESLVGLGALTPLQVWAEGHPHTPSAGASGCQKQGLAAALAKEQGVGPRSQWGLCSVLEGFPEEWLVQSPPGWGAGGPAGPKKPNISEMVATEREAG